MRDGQLKLHVCCGNVRLDGWVNIDQRKTPAVDIICDCGHLDFEPGTAGMIYCCHGLDHWTRHEYLDVLSHWRDVLKPGGVLRLSVIDFAVVSDLYQGGMAMTDLIGCLCARQDYPTNVRHMHWDEASLTADLRKVGFSSVRKWAEESATDCSLATVRFHDKDVPISLNLEAVK